VFVYDLKKLLEIAILLLNKEAKDSLLLHQFVAGLLEGIRRQIQVSGEVKTFEAAVTCTRLLMALDFQPVAAVHKPTNGSSEVQQLKDQVAVLTEQVAFLATCQRYTN